jgi:DDE superfamily endonuclease
VPKGVPSTLCRQTRLRRMDLPLRGPRTHQRGELLPGYLPGMDDLGCLEVFLGELSKRYPDHHLLVVLDGVPSHRSERIAYPENISFLRLPAYSPELETAERWFEEFRRSLSKRALESVAQIQEALTKTLLPYWERPSLLKRLTGYAWWVKAVEEAL